MMYNTRYLPENFDQCRLEKTILRQFPYNLSVRSSWNALIQDGGKYHEKAYEAQTGKGNDKRIRLCFETEDLHQDCPGIHEKYSIIIKLLSVQLEENYYQFQVRFLPGFCLSVCDLVRRLAMVPAIQPIYQNVLEVCLDVANYYIG